MDAQDYLGIDHDKDIPFFTKLATEAEKKIGSYFQYERHIEVLDICGCIALLPSDSILVEIAVMGNQDNDCCTNLFNRMCGVSGTTTNLADNVNFLVIDIGGGIGDEVSFGYVGYEIQNNKIIFDVDRDSEQVTIQYLRLKRDCDGFVEVGENHIEAITWYIIYRYYFRKSLSNYMERDKMREAKAEWERNCAHARAEDNRMTYPDRQQAANLYADPYSGKGIWQGMSTTLGTRFSIW